MNEEHKISCHATQHNGPKTSKIGISGGSWISTDGASSLTLYQWQYIICSIGDVCIIFIAIYVYVSPLSGMTISAVRG